MTWFKVDDGFHSHPKVLRAGNAATGLWTRCGSWSARYLTDGWIPAEIARDYGTKNEANLLVRAGLWTREKGGFRMRDFHDYNPTADEVREKRQVRADAGRLGGIASGNVRRSKHEANASPVASPAREAKTNPVPSRPVLLTSSSVLTVVPTPAVDDDDDFVKVLELVVDAKMRDRHPKNRNGYRATVTRNTTLEDGELIRRMIADGTQPEHVALFVLGHGTDAAVNGGGKPIPWCGPDCHICDGDAWIDEGDGRYAPCPARIEAQRNAVIGRVDQ